MREAWQTYPVQILVGLGQRSMAPLMSFLHKENNVQVYLHDDDPAWQERDWVKPFLAEDGFLALTDQRMKAFSAEETLAIVSPGVPLSHAKLQRIREMGVECVSELEYSARCRPDLKQIFVTGTLGKSTVCQWITDLLCSTGIQAEPAGNFGRSLMAFPGTGVDVAVVEASSFQLELWKGFSPDVAVGLGMSPNHLDRHGSMEAYIGAKRSLFEALDQNSFAALNAEDPVARSWAKCGSAQAKLFGFEDQEAQLVWTDLGMVYEGKPLTRLGSVHSDFLQGDIDRLNLMASFLAISEMVNLDELTPKHLETLTRLPFRRQVIGKSNGWTFVNDSKGTTLEAALAAIEGAKAPVVWIAGGLSKGQDFSALTKTPLTKVSQVLVFGDASEALAEALSHKEVKRCADLKDVFDKLADLPQSDGIILFSPACASFDQYASYEARGRHFNELTSDFMMAGVA